MFCGLNSTGCAILSSETILAHFGEEGTLSPIQEHVLVMLFNFSTRGKPTDL